MKTIQVTQGSTQWLDLRRQYDTASECPVMMGASKYQTRADLMRQKATGITPDVDPRQQALYDRGHATEGASRDILEEKTGEAFYPVTAVDEARKLLASVDGITVDDSTLFEHKLFTKSLAAQVQAGDLDPHYYWQLEQQILVTGAEKVIFVCSDGTPDNWAQMEYRAVPGRAEQLIAGWKQFNEDLAAYVPPTPSAVEKIVAEPVESLPAVFVQVTGALAVTDNFKAFDVAVRDFLANRLIREPKTDQDFADLDLQIKAMKAAEAALDAAEGQMLAQITAVDQAKKTKDMLAKLVRENRLMAEKLLSSEKERRKGEIVAGGVSGLKAHIEALTAQIGKPYLPAIPADFGGAIKGLRSLASMEDAVSTELARAKIVATETANRIIVILALLQAEADGLQYLFVDAAQMVIKDTDDFKTLVALRVSQHKAAEAAKEEATRERIRAEEQAKAEKAASDKLAAELAEAQRLADEQARQATPPAAPAPEPVRVPVASAPVPAPAANVVPISRPAAPADTGARVKLGDIAASIAPLSITADGLASLGFPHVGTDKAAKLYRTADLPRIYAAMVAHIEAAQAKQAA